MTDMDHAVAVLVRLHEVAPRLTREHRLALDVAERVGGDFVAAAERVLASLGEGRKLPTTREGT